MVSADVIRSLKGRSAALTLTDAAGGESLRGRIASFLESVDGLVVFLVDPEGHTHTIHYHHIAELEPLETGLKG